MRRGVSVLIGVIILVRVSVITLVSGIHSLLVSE